MIGCFTDPYPDEIIYSVCARVQDHMRFPNKEAVNATLFGARGKAATVDLPSHIKFLTLNLPPGHGYAVDDLINDHTLFPFYAPFLPPDRVARLIRDMGSSNGSAVHNHAGITPSNIRLPDLLRFCPTCLVEDKNKFGECYWHRAHQSPCVEVCPTHLVFLESSTVRARNRTNPGVYSSAEQFALATPARALDISLTDHQILLRLAEDAYWLLGQRNLYRNYDKLRQCYLMLLAEKGFTLPNSKVRVKELIYAIRGKYSHDLLERLHCEFNERKEFNWPSLVVPRLSHNKTDIPTRHLLLIQLLGHTAESFFQACAERKTAQPPQNIKPFGNGPWPCLNPVCWYSKRRVIKTCEVSTKTYHKKLPVGIFTCRCGFSYARKGPDSSLDDAYRYDWVISYGSAWENTLRELWGNSSLSIRQVASKLHASHAFVTTYAARLALKFPRIGPVPKVTDMSLRDQARIREGWLGKSESSRTELRAGNRVEWLSVREKYPAATRTQIKCEIAPRLYRWLMAHDRAWLRAHLPPQAKRVGSARQVDWAKRDVELAQKVRASAERLKREHGRPMRVTRQAIGRDIDKLTFIASKAQLARLPLTAKVLAEVVESRVDFVVRRI